MKGSFDSSLNAMIDEWSSLMVSLEDFKANIFDIGIDFAKKNKVTTWIVDTSQADGVFKKEVQQFVETTVAPTCSKIGIKYFFVILPQSAISKLSAKNVAKINANQQGMQTIQVGSMEEVKRLLAEND